MTSLTVTHNFKSVNVAVTPSTPLAQVLAEFCSKNSLNADDWTLTSKGKELDLSLTFRLSGLVSNGKLELKRRQVSVTTSQVTIALQLPEGGRVQGVFNPQTSLWAIITHYEQNLKQNFTKNEGPVEGSKDKTPVYKQPVINFTNREIATNRELRATTLQALGLTKGSGLLRFFFRPSNKSLQQIEEEEKVIEEETKVREEEQEQVKKQIAEKEQDAREKRAQEEREKQQATSVYEEEERRKLQAREAELKAEAERRAAVEKKRLEQLDEHEREKAIQERVMFEKWKADKEKKELDLRSKQLKDQEEWDAWVQGKTTSTNTNSSTLSTSSDKMEIDEPIKPVQPLADRQIKVLAPSNTPFDPATIELPEDFFNVTKEDLDREMRARNERKRQEEQDKSHLKTREMREIERLQRLKKWNKTMIRIRFPDRVELQANFLPNEYTNTLVEFVKSNLVDPNVNFYLYTSPPIERLPMNKTFMQLSYLPAVLVHFGLEQGSQVYGSFLKKDLLVEIQEKLPPPIMHVSAFEVSKSVNPTPAHTNTNTNNNRNTDESKPKKSGDKSGVPKWFRKQ
jgi:tether containing UBX domain for GLUT4